MNSTDGLPKIEREPLRINKMLVKRLKVQTSLSQGAGIFGKIITEAVWNKTTVNR